MRLRATQLATLILLLATLGVAESSTLHDGTLRLGSHYAASLRAQDDAGITALNTRLDRATAFGPANHVASSYVAFAWTMRPPAAHSLHVHAVTASHI